MYLYFIHRRMKTLHLVGYCFYCKASRVLTFQTTLTFTTLLINSSTSVTAEMTCYNFLFTELFCDYLRVWNWESVLGTKKWIFTIIQINATIFIYCYIFNFICKKLISSNVFTVIDKRGTLFPWWQPDNWIIYPASFQPLTNSIWLNKRNGWKRGSSD